MAFVGFTFNKIEVVKNEITKGKVAISNTVNVTDVTPADLKIGSKDEHSVKFSFEYKTLYGDLGHITLDGSLTYLSTALEIKSVLDEWKKDKKVRKKLMEVLVNRILSKCNVQSIILSDTVALPPPVPMPKVKAE